MIRITSLFKVVEKAKCKRDGGGGVRGKGGCGGRGGVGEGGVWGVG